MAPEALPPPLSAAKMMLNTPQLNTQDQLFEYIMPLELIDAENAISDWSCEAEDHCLRWRIAFTNFFSQGTQVGRLQTLS